MKASDETARDGAVRTESSGLTHRISPSEPPSTAVVEATAEATGSSVIGPTDDDDKDVLAPLYEAIDPDALDTLFRPTTRGEERPGGRISFEYEGCDVAVLRSGVVTVQQKDEVTEPIDTDD